MGSFGKAKKILAFVLIFAIILAGCQKARKEETKEQGTHPEISGLTYERTMTPEYAEGFVIHYYEGGFKLLEVMADRSYLLVPEEKEVPEGLSSEIEVIKAPAENIYLAATASMSFFDSLKRLDAVTMTSLTSEDWTLENQKKAMEEGSIVYAGKYSEPDYEMLVKSGCSLAIESTMILHTPEVKEMLEDLDITVFVDYASYEKTALGRVEWIKLYGALLGEEEKAEAEFKLQEELLDELAKPESTGKTVAFFAVNTDNTITVRKTEDFIPNAIESAGGTYIFEDLGNPDSDSASVRISMEEFYAKAVDADYLVYNGTIEKPLESVEELIELDPLFADFKGVKEGRIYSLDRTWYQSAARVGFLIRDFNLMLNDEDMNQAEFLYKVN
ncbi:MAG: ABC transporter substrate-binding protein [Clostridiales bacterium]|nr:ABC transporter substrate-binding protein [Clostridiales bacterium]